LYKYTPFTYSEVYPGFIPGTFGYAEQYNDQTNLSNSITINYLQNGVSWNSLFICFSRFRRLIWLYVFRLGYSNLWSSLCCKCIIKI
jgi:hypothetical protein